MGATPKTVGFLLYQDCTLLDFAGATQVFAQWASHWNPVWISHSLAPVRTSEGLDVLPSATFDKHPDLDIVFVPGGAGVGVATAMGDPACLGWLTGVATARPDTWVGAVCVGTFILAAAGLLEGAQVTTHWRLLEQLRCLAPICDMTVAEGYPRALVDPARRRFSGGGVSASIDLALTLVRDLNDADAATTAALLLQYDPELPKGVLAGSPDTTDPEVLAAVTDNPSLDRNLVAPIAAAAKALKGTVE